MRAPQNYALLLLAGQYAESHMNAARYALSMRGRACTDTALRTEASRIMAGIAREYHRRTASTLGVQLNRWGGPLSTIESSPMLRAIWRQRKLRQFYRQWGRRGPQPKPDLRGDQDGPAMTGQGHHLQALAVVREWLTRPTENGSEHGMQQLLDCIQFEMDNAVRSAQPGNVAVTGGFDTAKLESTLAYLVVKAQDARGESR